LFAENTFGKNVNLKLTIKFVNAERVHFIKPVKIKIAENIKFSEAINLLNLRPLKILQQ
jgi:hypothetical protein